MEIEQKKEDGELSFFANRASFDFVVAFSTMKQREFPLICMRYFILFVESLTGRW